MITLSASSLLNYAKCSYSFYLSKTTEEAQKTKHTATGSAFHKLVELMLLGASYKEALGEIIENNTALVDFTELKAFYESYKNELEKLKDAGVLYLEKEFVLELSDDISIHGFIDIITTDRRLIELKTTRNISKAPQPQHIFQVSVYKLADEADRYELHYVAPFEFKKVPVNPLPTKTILNIIEQVKKLVETGQYPPLGLLTGYCQYCLYKSYCEYYAGGDKS